MENEYPDTHICDGSFPPSARHHHRLLCCHAAAAVVNSDDTAAGRGDKLVSVRRPLGRRHRHPAYRGRQPGTRGPIVVVQECLVLFLFYYLRNEVQHIVIKEKEEVYQYSLSES